MDFDDILPHLGSYGKYQIILLCLMATVANVPCCFTYVSVVFISGTPDHWCRIPELEVYYSMDIIKNISIPLETRDGVEVYSQCKMYDYNYTQILLNGFPDNRSVAQVACKDGWNYDKSVYESTLVTEMDVVCGDRWLQSIAESSYFFGHMIGSIIFGNLANIYGRKSTFYVLMSVYILVGILSSFPPNYVAYIAYRTIIGTTSTVIFQIPFVLAMEMVKPQKRSTSGMSICSMFPFVIAFMCLLAYLSRNWFTLSLITSVPLVVFLIIWYFVPESPRWLITRNRIDEAEVIIQKIAKVNKKSIPPNFLKTFMESKSVENKEENKEAETKYNIIHLIKYPNIRKSFLLVSIGWLVNATVYAGLLFGSTMLNINDYLALTISGLVEVPGNFLAWWGMEKYGRRFIMLIFMILAGICCICAGITPGSYVWTIVVVTNIGKFAIAGSYSAVYVYGSELIPTVLRTAALAAASLIGSVGSMIAPNINYLGTLYGRALPLTILGILSIVGGVCHLFLPETLNENLPDTIEEGEKFAKNTKFCEFPFTKSGKKRKLSRSSMRKDSKSVSVNNYELQ